MVQTTPAVQPVTAVFAAGAIALRLAGNAPSRFADDRETLYKEFAKRLHALVWCEG